MKKVLISAPYMVRERKKVERLLEGLNAEFVWAEVQERLEETQLIEALHGVSAIICGDDRFTEKVYQTATQLDVVIKWGTGIDSIRLDIAQKYGVKVCRTPGAFTDPVADTALAYMLAYARQIRENDIVLKSGQWYKPPGSMMKEHTVGIIGYGTIGKAVASRLVAFGCRILAYDINEEVFTYPCSVEKVSLAYLVKNATILTLHCDLNSDSLRLLNKEMFDQMVKQPFIINTARGPIVVEEDLVNALEDGKVSGAALDVFEQEPLSVESRLRKMDKVMLAAHNSNSSKTCWMNVHLNSVRMLCKELGLGRMQSDSSRSHEASQ
ncbi:MAG: hypothetical protein OXT67_01605 [Zetaproteobacteria bacterium]|nr:hypothetical protein [Zetaproteobacteria bacterium]